MAASLLVFLKVRIAEFTASNAETFWQENIQYAPTWCTLRLWHLLRAPYVTSVSLPPDVARQMRSIAKSKQQSANRVFVELIEDGIEAQNRKQPDFFLLAERFRASDDESEVKRLGEELGPHGFRRLMA